VSRRVPREVLGAKEQVARLLTLVPYLHSRDGVRLAEVADALGVTSEQVVSDLKVLFMCGLPGGYPDELIDVDLDAVQGEGGELRPDGLVRVSNADYLARPMRLSAVEASALVVALEALRVGVGPEVTEIVDRVLAKLRSAAASAPAPGSVAQDPRDAALTRVLIECERAIEGQRQLEFDYYVPARDELGRRTVDPWSLLRNGPFTYLDAWCHTAGAPRLFRLDRISRCRRLDTPLEKPAGSARTPEQALFEREDDLLVTLLLEPEARWVVEYYAVEAVRHREGGRLEVDLYVADDRWLTRLLLRLAPNAVVLAPAEAAHGFLDASQAALSLYDTTPA